MLDSSVILRNVVWIDRPFGFAWSKQLVRSHSLTMTCQHTMNVYNSQHGQPQSSVPVSAPGNTSVSIYGVTDSQQHAQAQLQLHA